MFVMKKIGVVLNGGIRFAGEGRFISATALPFLSELTVSKVVEPSLITSQSNDQSFCDGPVPDEIRISS
jgi:hypothetical protein